ncbi:unnamed protein product [Cylindrotheca closterium]|uniref:Cytochrome b561 domain-containing protein n=1 Tax=Cylindrotheca closterium TaxID=2856 RepID=A0AAD2FRN7_9STRA|nr:unnamed protein product [Cylindrotheca closterium]
MAGPIMSKSKHQNISIAYLVYALLIGRYIATQPKGDWSFFSWHPFLMICGFMGAMGIAAATKKKGGYTNTKYHGYLSSAGFVLACAGMYIIYRNKDLHERPHFTSTHAWMGIATMVCAFLPAVFGVVFLHPDFGMDKTNKTYRFAHKWCSRTAIVGAYVTGYWGLAKMTQDPLVLATYALPLMVLTPFTLL